MVDWTLVYSREAVKDSRKLAQAGLRPKAEALLAVVREDPWRTPPPCEKLLGNLAGAYSRRISLQHRLVYEVVVETRTVKILRMWTHYE